MLDSFRGSAFRALGACLLGLGVLLLPLANAAGEPALAGLHISLDPPLLVVSRTPSGAVFTAGGDETIQLGVAATYADGTTADVTASATFTPLSPVLAVTPGGVLTFSAAPPDGNAGLEVVYGSQRHLLIFVVNP